MVFAREKRLWALGIYGFQNAERACGRRLKSSARELKMKHSHSDSQLLNLRFKSYNALKNDFWI